ncbi:CDP-diacylglycerol--glycerol-3-phosphate 3-phosphatidyltransferase [Liberiplasma polymorphum]|uniref:CDP-diacylglycerol--glycerol-3-phosphate 3-phosphatidyltransferase n=1 Tax=Liberiplasma polymorphum TaxID=3374570 RepID=UPI003770FB2F
MNLPNKLTMLRVILIPVIVVLYYIEKEAILASGYSITIGIIFIIGSLTDYFDGYLARKHNLITTFGKFLDPLADKLLVMCALLILQELTIIPMWAVLVILTREFIVTGIRLVAVGEEGNVIAASNLGKYKTFSTMLAITFLLLRFNATIEMIGLVLFYIGVALTVISGFDYFQKNKILILKSK